MPAQRLNRTEYANAVKDLLDVDIDPAEYLPPEIEVKGFTTSRRRSVSRRRSSSNMSTPRARSRISRSASQSLRSRRRSFLSRPSDQTGYVDRDAARHARRHEATHTFPADGEYRLTITNLGAGLYPRSLETRHTLVVLVDRHEEWRGDIGGEEDLALIDRGGAPAREEIMKRFMNIPLQVKAGTHEIAVTFIERSRAASDELVSTFTPPDRRSARPVLRACPASKGAST